MMHRVASTVMPLLSLHIVSGYFYSVNLKIKLTSLIYAHLAVSNKCETGQILSKTRLKHKNTHTLPGEDHPYYILILHH